MFDKGQSQNIGMIIAALCLIIVTIVAYPASRLYAQDVTNSEIPTEPDTAVDDATFDWENVSTPYVEKADATITDADPDDAKKTKQFAHSLFLPTARTNARVNDASIAAAWQTVHLQTFESTFPPPTGWLISDYNGPSVGVRVNASATLVWDDTATRAYQGYWSAHPNDWNGYANHTDTWMRYGPFSLVGATNARFSFAYWLDSEQYYDNFTWEYSCSSPVGLGWVGSTRSGSVKQWVTASVPMTVCAGKSAVYIRFNFKSDYSNPSSPALTGVWVDNIRIEKYQ